MAISFLTDFVGFGLGLVVGGAGIWLLHAARVDTARRELANALANLAGSTARAEQIPTLNSKIENLNETLTKVQSELAEARRDCAHYSSQVRSFEEKLQAQQKENVELRNEVQKLDVEKAKVYAEITKEREHAADKLELLTNAKDELSHQSKSAAGEINNLNEALTKAQSELAEARRDCAHYSSQVRSFEEKLQAQQKENVELRNEVQKLDIEKAKVYAEVTKEREHAADKLKILTHAKDELSHQFRSVAAEILDEKSKKFTDLNAANLSSILDPLKSKLEEFKGKVEESYDKESKQRFALEQEIKRLVSTTDQLDTEAKSLTQALKGDSKARGTWGELVLERVLERSGLREGQEYRSQSSCETESGGRAQPDIIVDLPEGRNVVIDSKVSLVAYERFVSEHDSLLRKKHLDDHVASLRNHIRELSEKKYQALYELKSLDFVLMFIPIEAAFSVAFQTAPETFNEAFSRNVLIVAPNTLLVTLRTIDFTWKQEYQTRNAQEIAKHAGSLYDKFSLFVNSVETIGQRIEQSQQAYEQAHKQLVSGKGNLVTQAEKLRKLGVQPSKPISQGMLEAADIGEEGEGLQVSAESSVNDLNTQSKW